MTRLLAIDPGNVESGYVVIDVTTRKPFEFGKVPNDQLVITLLEWAQAIEHVAIEMVASYGMAVGATVFETCVWVGRFQQTLDLLSPATTVELVKRNPVKVHHCHSSKANDSNVRQALVDRFAPGQANHGKGTKASPGWFHGFRADIWQAYALAVYAADTLTDPTPQDGAPY